MDALQAGILRVKLRALERWNKQRQTAAENYNQLLAAADWIITPYEPAWSRAVYHLYVVRVPKRDELQKHLADRGIGTALHYPVPLHLQEAYVYLGYRKGDLPVSEEAAREILSLPMFPKILREQQEQVAEAVLQADPAGALT